MVIQATSLIALEEILSKINERQRQVLNVFKTLNRPLNNLEVSRFLNLPINSVTPRCQELRKMGLLIFYEIKACPYTGRASRFYILKDWINGVLQ